MATDKPPGEEPVQCTSGENEDELTSVLVVQDEKPKEKLTEELSVNKVHEQSSEKEDELTSVLVVQDEKPKEKLSEELSVIRVHEQSSEKGDELTSVLAVQDEKPREKQVVVLSGMQLHEQDEETSSHVYNESENMHELSTIITDVYSLTGEKFGHDDLIHLIEAEPSLENWQHNHDYSHADIDSFSQTTHIEPSSMQPCTSNMQLTSEQSSVTLTVLNSIHTDEAAHSIPFSFTQPVRHSSSLDHDYYAYHALSHKPESSAMECFQMHNSMYMQDQTEMRMDHEKLQRMKRRKEKNRECSRQFRLKQKDKERRLALGKVEKSKTLDGTKKNVGKLKAILSKISQKCSNCPKAAMLLNEFMIGSDKENINPNMA